MRTQLQRIIDNVVRICNEYSMEINVKKTIVMVFSKKQGTKSVIEVNREKLEQVSGYKYLGIWVTEDGKSEKEVKARIGKAKGAFWKLKELLKGNVNMTTRKRLLNCYVFSVLKYGCESWTMNKNLMK